MRKFAALSGLLICAGMGAGCLSSTGTPSSCDSDSVNLDLPLDYTIVDDGSGQPESVMIQTDGGPVRMIFTPWGPHSEPHTGHPGGDSKSNWLGYLAPKRSDLTELSGDGDGVCESGEACGLPESEVLAKRPRYIAPDDGFEIQAVILDRVHSPGFYWGTLNQWRIEGELCGRVYSFGHVGWVAEDLRAAMLAAGAPDPQTYSGPTGVNLLGSSLVLEQGKSIAIPQIVGQASSVHTGYVMGDVWAQMEVPTRNKDLGRDEPVFSWLSSAMQSRFRKILHREMQDPTSRLYASWPTFAWLWRAESDLWTVPFRSPDDYSALTSNLGTWFETRTDGSACSSGSDPLCDQAVTLWPITKGSGSLYDSSLYDSPSVSFLIMRSQRGDTYYRGEILTPSSLSATTGTLLVKWRLKSYLTPIESYQKISYSLNSGAKLLKLHWGAENASRTVVEASADPSNPASLACNGTSVTCLNHDWPTAGPPPGY